MVTPTDRFGLNSYNAGEDNWTHDDLVQKFDQLAIDSGPIADRPTDGSYDDELYYATDQNILWRYDGSALDWVAGFGADGDPVPGTSYFESLEAGNIDSKNGYEAKTASRSIGTWYQNTTGGDLNVAVSVNCDTDSQIFHILLDVSETQTQNRVDQFIEDPSSSGTRITVTSTVPDGFYYRVVNNAGANASLQRWVEQ